MHLLKGINRLVVISSFCFSSSLLATSLNDVATPHFVNAVDENTPSKPSTSSNEQGSPPAPAVQAIPQPIPNEQNSADTASQSTSDTTSSAIPTQPAVPESSSPSNKQKPPINDTISN